MSTDVQQSQGLGFIPKSTQARETTISSLAIYQGVYLCWTMDFLPPHSAPELMEPSDCGQL